MNNMNDDRSIMPVDENHDTSKLPAGLSHKKIDRISKDFTYKQASYCDNAEPSPLSFRHVIKNEVQQVSQPPTSSAPLLTTPRV